ncbi:hypothetical protein [Polaribacter sp. Asnod1-A03]|uniref:hypothetical protein n=1 Tax=Polaribacter sp. Asnod1-A03 TaxID=3160581 RepID=UPI0038689A80
MKLTLVRFFKISYILLDFKIPESEIHHYDEWSAVTLPNKADDRIIIHNHSHSPER